MKIVLQVAKQSFGWIFVLYTCFPHGGLSFFCVFSDICWACPNETWISPGVCMFWWDRVEIIRYEFLLTGFGAFPLALMLHKD